MLVSLTTQQSSPKTATPEVPPDPKPAGLRRTLTPMRRLTAITLFLLTACSGGPEVSQHTEWLAAITGERDAAKVQTALNLVHEQLDMGTGPDVDRDSVQLIADIRDNNVTLLLDCMATVAEREGASGPAAFVDLAVRCDDDWQLAYES